VDSVDQERAPRFPTSAGMLLGAAVCAHLAALVQGVFGEPTTGATLFFLGEVALSFALLRIIDGEWVFQDIRVFFVLFFFLYGGTLPLIVTVTGQGNQEVAGAVFLYGTALFAFNVVQWWYKEPWHDVPPAVFARIRPSSVNLLILLAAFGFLVAYLYYRGLRLAFSIDRAQARFFGTQLWVVSQFVMNGAAMFMFAGWTNLSRRTRMIVAVVGTAFALIHLSFGNRRDFLPLLVFIAVLVATRRQAVIRIGAVVVGFLAFAFFLLVGLVRQIMQFPSLLTQNSVQLLLAQNEFVVPIQTLMHYVIVDRPLRWGWTYLSAPSLFVPRAIWSGKPESLSLQFLRDKFGYTVGLMGYAYTPVTEAFLNFGWVGPFVIFAILSLLMVKLVRHADAHASLYFISFAMVVDFNRGDFGGIFYTMVVIGASYYMMHLVSTLRWAGRGSPAPLRTLPEARSSGQRAALNC
jgi:O-antigen polysaccharide polymerase Wzy